MAFDLALLKEHPYATGGVVIAGGLVVLYFLSSSQGSAGSSAVPGGGGGIDYASIYAANAQMAQVNAAAQVQTNAQQVDLQKQQLDAMVAKYQTDASIESNDQNLAATLAATLAQIQADKETTVYTLDSQTKQQANQLMYAQNIQQMQDDVLMANINSGVLENANNNATVLAGTQSTLDYQASLDRLQAAVAVHGIDAGLTLAQQQEADFQTNVNAIIPQAGKSYNTANDANRATTLFSQILARGNPSPVITNQQGQTAQNIAQTGMIGSVLDGVTRVAAGLLA
jgi:hypothetical protein